MANTTDFISAVYDELAKLLGGQAGATSFMQMAWPGYTLSPADFRRADAPNGPYDPEVAREAFSQLANIVPTFDKLRFENSGFELDDLYEIVLSSAIPAGTTGADNLAVNPIYRLFSDAQYELMQARRGRHDDPNAFYYPCSATPTSWYDDSVTQGWTDVSLDQSDVKPAGASTPFVKLGGLEFARTGVWRLKPGVADTTAVRKTLQDSVVRKASALRPGLVAPAALAPAELRRPNRAGGPPKPASAPAPGKELFARPNGPTPALARSPLDVSRIDLLRPDLGVSDLTRRMALKSVVDRQLRTKPASPATDGFSVSFKYCRVNIDRPWLKLALLNTRNWWMFDTPAGEYSTGAADANPGMFPLLTTSFIVIRDLRISANWSQEDRNDLANAASFGFFDLRDGTVNNNTIEVKGMQIIAWVSRVTPRMPPLGPPA